MLSTPARIQAIGELGTEVGTNVRRMLEFYHRYDVEEYGGEGGPLHDPCTVAYLLAPELFEGKLVNVAVETESELTMGETVVDFWRVTDRQPNAVWIHRADADGFFALLTERLSRLR